MSDTSEPIHLYWWKPAAIIPALDEYCLRHYNFGDEISPYIVSQLSGREVIQTKDSPKLLAVGSVFYQAKEGDTIWGSGLMGSKLKQERVDIRAVRGPLTRQELLVIDVDCPAVYGDPALLLPEIYGGRANPTRKWGFIPHLEEIDLYREYQPYIINVCWPWQKVVDEILECEFVISSSLHGIIVAEAYGIPAVWLNTNGDTFKFQDYYQSTGREGVPVASVEEGLRLLKQPPELHIDLEALRRSFPYPKGK